MSLSVAARPGKGVFAGWMGLAAVVIVLDQISKIAITKAFQLGEAVSYTSFFDLVFVFNRGAAFSFLNEAGGWQRWFFLALAIAISLWLAVMVWQHRGQILAPLAFSLVIGGALGNAIDRVVYGAVVDFLYFHAGSHGFPAFNLADSAITLGVGLMIWDQLFGAGRQTR